MASHSTENQVQKSAPGKTRKNSSARPGTIVALSMARKPNRRIVQGRCAGCGQDRPLKYNRRTMCAYYKCAEAAKRAVAARRDSEGDDGSVVCDQEEEEFSFCFKVTKVLGQRDCDAENLSRVQRRNKLADDDQRVAYLIYRCI